jgi:hypothetical protein
VPLLHACIRCHWQGCCGSCQCCRAGPAAWCCGVQYLRWCQEGVPGRWAGHQVCMRQGAVRLGCLLGTGSIPNQSKNRSLAISALALYGCGDSKPNPLVASLVRPHPSPPRRRVRLRRRSPRRAHARVHVPRRMMPRVTTRVRPAGPRVARQGPRVRPQQQVATRVRPLHHLAAQPQRQLLGQPQQHLQVLQGTTLQQWRGRGPHLPLRGPLQATPQGSPLPMGSSQAQTPPQSLSRQLWEAAARQSLFLQWHPQQEPSPLQLCQRHPGLPPLEQWCRPGEQSLGAKHRCVPACQGQQLL